MLDPAGALEEWVALHKAALKGRRISKVRALLTGGAGIGLDDADRRMVGGALWARTHRRLGVTLWETPVAPLAPALTDAIEHFESALRVYTESDFPADWAGMQNNLGAAYAQLPTGVRAENLRKAIACYESALCMYTESNFPAEWAGTQNNLGNAYLKFC